MTRIFVYGTLLQEESNHHLLAGARFLGTGATEPEYSLVDLGPYPAMIPYGRSSVVGEIYEVSPEILEKIDELEGHPEWYRRTSIRLVSDDAATETYVMAPEQVQGQPVISSGNWRSVSHGKKD